MKLFSRATVTGGNLTGANLKATFTMLWDALNSAGFSDASRTTITSTSSLLTTQCGLLLVDATGGNITLTLPASGSATDDAFYILRRIDTTANTVTLQRAGSDTVEGGTSITLPPNSSTEIQIPGGSINWRVIGIGAPTAAGTRAAISASAEPFRNIIINGDMSVDQRNAGAAQTITAAAALAYCIDRFYAYCTGANATGQQVTGADARSRYRFTGAASVTAIGFGHRVEAKNSRHLAGQTCTISAKLSNSLLTTVNWALYYANTADTFGTLASPTRTSIASGSWTVNSTEATYSAQVAVPAGATTGLELVLTVGAQVSGTWTIGDAQIERGAIANAAITPEMVDATLQLQRCQRRCYINQGPVMGRVNSNQASVRFMFPFPVPMAGAPNAALLKTTIAWEEMQQFARGYTSASILAQTNQVGSGYVDLLGTNSSGVPNAGALAQLNELAAIKFEIEL